MQWNRWSAWLLDLCDSQVTGYGVQAIRAPDSDLFASSLGLMGTGWMGLAKPMQVLPDQPRLRMPLRDGSLACQCPCLRPHVRHSDAWACHTRLGREPYCASVENQNLRCMQRWGAEAACIRHAHD